MREFKSHFIDRDATEQYVVLFTDEPNIKVFSLLDGSERSVSLGTATGYLNGLTDPANELKVVTHADTTIVVNKTVTPAMGAITPLWNPFGIVNVTHGVAGTTYTISINGVAVTYTSGSTTEYSTYSTETIANALFEGLADWVALQGDALDWQVVSDGSCVLIFNSAGTDFTLTAKDTWGNAALVAIKEQAQKVEDLPNRMPESSLYPTDVFHTNGYWEYWLNCLTMDDPATPGAFIEISHSVSSYGHGDSSAAESANMFYDMAYAALITNNTDDTKAWYAAPGTWQVTHVNGGTVSIWRTDGVRTKLYVGRSYNRDGAHNGPIYDTALMAVSHHEIVSFSGMSLKVYNSKKTGDVGYYLRWTDTAGSRNATGAWVEAVAGGIANSFDAATMPHQLVRQGDGTFLFSPITWLPRAVGDEDSAPTPSFVGKQITDVFFHKNRLSFLSSGATVCQSKSSDYYNFFPTSAMEVVDDDPIDVEIPTPTVSTLQWGVSSDDDLLLFGGDKQYLVTAGDQIYGPKSVAGKVGTNFPVSESAQPVRCGANLYLFSEKNNYGAVFEYFTVPQTLTNDAADITAHAPRLLPAGLMTLAAAPQHQMLFLTGDDTDTIYCYKYYWAGDQKVQSAWFKWTLPYTVKSVGVVDGFLYILGDLTDTLILTKMNLERADHATVVCEDETSASAATPITMSFTFSRFGVPAPKSNVYEKQGRLQLRTLTLAGVVLSSGVSPPTTPWTTVGIQYVGDGWSYLSDSASEFLARLPGLVAGRSIAVSGFSITSNNRTYLVHSVVPGTIEISPAIDIYNEAAGNEITIVDLGVV